MTIYECIYFYVYILSLVFFIIEVEHVLLDITKKKKKKKEKVHNIFFGSMLRTHVVLDFY